MLNESNKKNFSKTIFAFYLMYSINILLKMSNKKVETSFSLIISSIERLKNSLDEDFKKVNFESGEKIQLGYKQLLIYRGYLVHWALFLLDNNLELFLDVLYEDKYFQMIETSFPYLFKYLICFSIIAKSKKFISKLKESFIKNKSEVEQDPYVQLFDSIFIDFDNDAAYDLVQKCKNLMKEDYFLNSFGSIFEEKIKETIVENYILLIFH